MKKIALLIAVLALMSLGSAQVAFAGQVVDPQADPAQEEPADEAEGEEADEAEEAEAAEEETEAVAEEAVETPPVEVPVEIPFLNAWINSPHNTADAEAFIHWDEDDPAVVPESCAKCHSTPGMIDYLGADGSEPLIVNQPVAVGSTVECMACHNDVAVELDSVLMPSGLVIDNLGHESICMECHQGRSSTVDVAEAIAGVEFPEDLDRIDESLSFINIHYYAAAATKYGTLAKGGYEYVGQAYEAAFMHVPGYSTCTDCHGAHSLEINLEECAACHEDVEELEDLRDIRMNGSLMDYDGDGDIEEGVYYELQALQEMLYTAIQEYAATVIEAPIIYDVHSHPYWFADPNANGVVDEGESIRDNAFASWTPRLLTAAYNYQVSLKDPGAFAHGGKYIIQLLHDSLASLNEALPEPVEGIDMALLVRNDAGHFDGSAEAFRHWDEDGAVPGSCAKCHTGEGLPFFLGENVTVSTDPSNGLQCTTCHSDLETFDLYAVEAVEFPSGAVIASENMEDNICMNCHQGRESGVDLETRLRDLEPDAVAEELRFVNPHYFAAGATRYGSEAIGAYQYDGNEYFGYFEHVGRYDSCVECHDAHQLEVQWEDCADCHENVEGPEGLVNIREWTEDFDGDGDAEEGIYFEIETMQEMLYAAIQAYAAEQVGTPIVYAHRYPYWFVDANADGIADDGDTENFAAWTPRLLKAAYNYQYIGVEPGSYAHNGWYITQILYDTLADMGADVSGMIRPEP